MSATDPRLTPMFDFRLTPVFDPRPTPTFESAAATHGSTDPHRVR